MAFGVKSMMFAAAIAAAAAGTMPAAAEEETVTPVPVFAVAVPAAQLFTETVAHEAGQLIEPVILKRRFPRMLGVYR